MTKAYAALLSPGRIGSLQLRNRIFMTAMGSNLAETDGHLNERIKAYYEARAKGGAALVIMGSVAISWPIGSANANQVAMSDDRYIPGMADLAERIHRHGGKIALQLQHAGVTSMNDVAAGRPLLVPSIPEDKGEGDIGPTLTPEEGMAMGRPFMQPTSKLHYKEATEEDLAWVCEQFADATERAKKAGIDAVELHAAHGYLISNFLSPSTNHRTDRYGGSLENRARLLVEVIQAIRARVGRDYPVWIRLDGVEFLKNEGITSLDACAAARLAEAAGVDAINVSSYADPNRGVGFSEAHATHIPCKFVPYAAAIKQAVNIPVITAGRIEPEIANELLLEGKVDFINMGRKLLADPDLPNKLMHGRPETIRPCIYCYTCISQIFVGSHVRCAVNATTAFERECAVIATDKPRRVLVVGGGPGGMETARVAALRGHDVTLCEQGSSLGGTVLFSAISYPPNGRLVSYLEQSLRDLPVKVHLNTRADEAWIRRHNPDVVVVATGARRDSLPIQGADLPHVLTGDSMRAMMGAGSGPAPGGLSPLAKVLVGIGRMLGVTRSPKLVEKASHYWLPFGRNIVIYGGGLVGIELAEFLAERGRNVTVLEESGLFGTQLMLVRRWRAFYECDRLGVARIANVKDVVIEPDRVRYVGKGGQERSIPADHIILAAGAEADMSFADSIRKAGFNVKTVGDCQSIGYIEGAIRNGHAVAREI